ncbi:MAG TPA: DUF3343 domain-containing protein [Chitinivibrionales bacterium]|jgi:hypothetical protein
MQKLIVIFESTHGVIKAERICTREGVNCQAIPVPRFISSDCGIALEINESDKQQVERILSAHAINHEFKQMP